MDPARSLPREGWKAGISDVAQIARALRDRSGAVLGRRMLLDDEVRDRFGLVLLSAELVNILPVGKPPLLLLVAISGIPEGKKRCLGEAVRGNAIEWDALLVDADAARGSTQARRHPVPAIVAKRVVLDVRA